MRCRGAGGREGGRKSRVKWRREGLLRMPSTFTFSHTSQDSSFWKMAQDRPMDVALVVRFARTEAGSGLGGVKLAALPPETDVEAGGGVTHASGTALFCSLCIFNLYKSSEEADSCRFAAPSAHLALRLRSCRGSAARSAPGS